jgi:hypothetical protein
MGLSRGDLVRNRRTGVIAEVIKEWWNEWAAQSRINCLPLGVARRDWEIWCAGDFEVINVENAA